MPVASEEFKIIYSTITLTELQDCEEIYACLLLIRAAVIVNRYISRHRFPQNLEVLQVYYAQNPKENIIETVVSKFDIFQIN